MDQSYQNNVYYQAVPPIKNAAYYRHKARDALRGKWIMAAGVCFLFALVSGGIATLASLPIFLTRIATLITSAKSDPTTLILTTLIGTAFSFAVSIFVISPITVGLHRIYLDLIDGKDVRFETLFSYFKKGYVSTVAANLLYSLLTAVAAIPTVLLSALGVMCFLGSYETSPILAVFVCSMLVLVGVCIFAVLAVLLTYRYSLMFFILAEYPTLSALDVLRNSAVLMQGNKWRFFCLQLSFIGWALLLIPIGTITCGIGSFIGQHALSAYVYTAQAAFYHDVAKRDAANDVEFPSLDPSDYDPDEDPNRPF